MGNAKAKWQVLFGIVSAVAFGIAGAVEPIGTFSRVEGYAYVIRDEGSVQAREGVRVKEGDGVLMLEDGRVTISFDDGCGYGLTDREVLIIGPQSPCVLGKGGSYQIDPYSGISTDPNVVAMAYKQAQAEGGGASVSAAGGAAGGTGSASLASGTVAGASSVGGATASVAASSASGLAGAAGGAAGGLGGVAGGLGGLATTAVAGAGVVVASTVAIASTTDSGRPSISTP
ncbi:MAG: hypothetical protein LGR52_06505 [Candidatus Thiosymbion ectosymbiont of Robbea hypermnestra]|nr:hypothetical protein [Candidatus Thiosymbion ectosymbiont of Robbea hypermnestra]